MQVLKLQQRAISLYVLILLLGFSKPAYAWTCLEIGQSITIQYTNAEKTIVENTFKVGDSYQSQDKTINNKCPGMCGVACGPNDDGLNRPWTEECLAHDLCVLDQNGKNSLIFDDACGDEFIKVLAGYFSFDYFFNKSCEILSE